MIEFFPSRTTFLSVFGLHIQWYAVCILTGAFVAYFFIRKAMEETRYINRDGFLDDLFIYCLWFGILGARLWYCIFYNFNFYFSNPVNILRIFDGGLAIHGGLIAGFICAFIICKKHNVSFLRVMDMTLPSVFIAQAFGRWGNFINQECFGPEVSEEYFNGILLFIKEGMYINGHYYMPMFFYESVLCLAGFVLIYFVLKKYQNKRGDLGYAYMMWYGVIRFFIEAKRTDSLYAGTFKTAQLVSIALVVIGVLGYVGVIDRLFVKKKKPTVIFDMDGTLIDTEKAIIATYRHLFTVRNREEEFTKEKEVEVLGPGLKEMFPKYFPGEDIDALMDEYAKKNYEMLAETAVPMENALTVLEDLYTKGYDLGIVSSRNKKSIEYCLKICGMDKYFKDIIGIHEVSALKPDPEGMFKIMNDNHFNKDDVIMIGDSASDILAGKNYGAYTVAYFFNDDRSEKLKSAEANREIHDLIDILNIVKEDHYFTYNLK